MSIISTTKILEAIEHYKKCGYKLIDVPQCVDFDVSQHTKPTGVPELFHRGMKVYVASAEQSFIQLHKEGKLQNGKYMALTPCYRHEAILDDTHYSMFLKLELINIIGVSNEVMNKDCVMSMIADASYFFHKHLLTTSKRTEEGIFTFDILAQNTKTELGSYGVRKMLDGTAYIYGTGIAEPRFSMSL